MSDKPETTVIENGAPKKKGRHCKRFWWIYLIVFCVIVAVVVPVVILVAVPKIAQHKIDDAELEVQGVNVLRTESNSYLMEINSTITTDGKIKAKIDAFEGVMYLEDLEGHTPFVHLNFPETNGDKHQQVNVSQEVDIADMDAFKTFNIWFHNNDTLRVTIEGKTKVKPSGLTRKYGVTFKKTIEIKGLNVFAGTKVLESESHISIEGDDQGRNFHGIAEIPNQSTFTLDIGNATFTNFVGGKNLGKLYLENFLLVPGINRVPISASMDQSEILSMIRQRPYCENGVFEIDMEGAGVVNNGQELSYFAAALASVNQTVELNIGTLLKQDLDYEVKCSK